MNMQIKATVAQMISAAVTGDVVQPLSGEIKGIVSSGDREAYEGSYKITPKVSEQTLETQGMRMLDDVVVQAIPYYAVDNAARGQTIVIGDGENGG